MPWANPQTGARGAISNLVEAKEGRSLCRSFTTSRERFDGVGVYKGEVCMVRARRLGRAGLPAALNRKAASGISS